MDFIVHNVDDNIHTSTYETLGDLMQAVHNLPKNQALVLTKEYKLLVSEIGY